MDVADLGGSGCHAPTVKIVFKRLRVPRLIVEVDVASQGRTVEEALANLREAVALYLDEIDDPDQHIAGTPLVTSFQVPGAAGLTPSEFLALLR
jgi:hypothetical protein